MGLQFFGFSQTPDLSTDWGTVGSGESPSSTSDGDVAVLDLTPEKNENFKIFLIKPDNDEYINDTRCLKRMLAPVGNTGSGMQQVVFHPVTVNEVSSLL